MRRASRILVAAHFATAPGDPRLHPLLDAGFELVWNTTGRFLAEDELIALLPGVVGTLAAVEPYTERVFAGAPELRVVSRFGVGYDQVDVQAAPGGGVGARKRAPRVVISARSRTQFTFRRRAQP